MVRDMLLQFKKLVNPPNPAGWAGRPSAILLILVAACLAVMFPAYAEQGSEKPTGLMCDLMAMPDRAGIIDTKPEFSWIVPGRERGSVQRVYRIMVASSDELLGDDKPDLWDSGKVASSASTAVEYDGPPLSPESSYFWKVRTWRGDEPGPWSETQMFRTGDPSQNPLGHTAAAYPLVESKAEPILLAKTAYGHFVDFGQAAFGTITFTAHSPVPQKLIIVLGEKPGAGQSVDKFPGGTIRARAMILDVKRGEHEYRVVIRSDKRNTGVAAIAMPDYIGEVMPFRYAEIRHTLEPVKLSDVKQTRIHYPFDYAAARFTSSMPMLDEVWDLSKYSIFATTFAGLYVDGDRERIPYEADAYINQLGHYSLDREYTMARLTHEYLLKNPTWPTEWAMHSVMMARADYMYTGDTESMAAFYELLKVKTLHELARDDGLISTEKSNIPPGLYERLNMTGPKYEMTFGRKLGDNVDWPPSERDDFDFRPINTVMNCFHYRALMDMAAMADALGKADDRDWFLDRAGKVRQAVNKKLFNRGTDLYVDGEGSDHSSLHANMFALAFGLVPDDRKAKVVRFVKSKGMACSVYGAQYLLEAMFDAGEDEYAIGLMTDESTDRSWPHMIHGVGTTITLEAWDRKYKPNLDWNHAWGAAPANIIPRKLMGIEPIEPGFARVRIMPRTGALEQASITTPTIRGQISLDFKKVGASREYVLSIPGNVVAELHLPVGDPAKVTEGGVPAAEAPCVKFIGEKDGRAVFELGPGDYRFRINP